MDKLLSHESKPINNEQSNLQIDGIDELKQVKEVKAKNKKKMSSKERFFEEHRSVNIIKMIFAYLKGKDIWESIYLNRNLINLFKDELLVKPCKYMSTRGYEDSLRTEIKKDRNSFLKDAENIIEKIYNISYLKLAANIHAQQVIGSLVRKIFIQDKVDVIQLKQTKKQKADIYYLGKFFHKVPTITMLNLENNQIKSSGFKYLKRIQFPSLEELILDKVGISDTSINHLFSNIKANFPVVKVLSLESCELSTNSTVVMAKNFDQLDLLEELSFHNNNISGKGLMNLLPVLEKCINLKKLIISKNDIKDVKLELQIYISKCNLESLIMGFNPLSADTIKFLCLGFKRNKALNELSLCGCNLNRTLIEHLIMEVIQCYHISILSLQENPSFIHSIVEKNENIVQKCNINYYRENYPIKDEFDGTPNKLEVKFSSLTKDAVDFIRSFKLSFGFFKKMNETEMNNGVSFDFY